MPAPLTMLHSESGSSDGAGERRSQLWTVIAESLDDAKAVLLSEEGIGRGSLYVNPQGVSPDGFLSCTSISPRQLTPAPVDGAGLFEVAVEYAYPSLVSFDKPTLPDGQLRFWIETAEESVPVDTDRRGNPIVNAADEPIDPPIQMLKDRETLVIEWSKFAADYLTVYASKTIYRKKVNSQPYSIGGFLIGNARNLLCRSVTVEEIPYPDASSGGRPLFRLQARLEFRASVTRGGQVVPGWDVPYLNRGRRVKTGNATDPYRQVAADSVKSGAVVGTSVITQPAWLDELGQSLSATANHRVAELYDEISFAGLTS